MLRIKLATFLVFFLAGVVSAGIYGTTPIASTVWTAGHSEHIAWIDDSGYPRLKDMGDVDIDLLSGDETLVATLAQRVKATTKSMDVWISPSWKYNGTDYYIRFTCDHPVIQAYTATFTILDMSTIPAHTVTSGTSAYPPHGQAQENHTTYPPGVSLYTPKLTLVLPDSTVVSTLAPRPTTVQPAATTPGVPVSGHDEGEDDLKRHGEDDTRHPSGAGDNAGQRIDLERLKFRLVFILWPALIGMTMAL